MARARRARDPERFRAQDRARRLAASEAQRERRRQRAKERREEQRLQRVADRKCVICGGQVPVHFIATRITCSDECRRQHQATHARNYYYRKTGGAPRESEEASKHLSAARKRAWASGAITFKPRDCRACGVSFVPNSAPQRYCTATCRRDGAVAKRYGLTPAEFRSIVERQGGRCAICGDTKRGWAKANSTRKDHLVVDHCHTTGKVRGLLCGDCNTALGRFGDDPTRLRAAADYLDAC